MLRRVGDRFRHRAGRHRDVIAAQLQVVHNLLFAPAADADIAVRCQVRRVPLAEVAALQIVAGVAAEQIFWRMAGAAVLQPLDQIGAAIELGGLARIALKAAVAEEKQIPAHHRQTNIIRETQIGLRHPVAHRFYRTHVHPQVVHILVADLHVGVVGHRRIKVFALFAFAVPHRAVEVAFGPAADTRLFIRRNVAGINAAERRADRVAAREGLFAARRGMARHAVARYRYVSAARHRRGIRRRGRLAGQRLVIRHVIGRGIAVLPQQTCGDNACDHRRAACKGCFFHITPLPVGRDFSGSDR